VFELINYGFIIAHFSAAPVGKLNSYGVTNLWFLWAMLAKLLRSETQAVGATEW
jgi:hypothetical protein